MSILPLTAGIGLYRRLLVLHFKRDVNLNGGAILQSYQLLAPLSPSKTGAPSARKGAAKSQWADQCCYPCPTDGSITV